MCKDFKYFYVFDVILCVKSKFINLIVVFVVLCRDIFMLIFGFVNFVLFKKNWMYMSYFILMLKVLLDNVEIYLKFC